MKTKLLLFASLMLWSVGIFAQWTKPTPPAGEELKAGDEIYLYNVEADAFFLGANDWGTRASVNPTHGHKVWLEAYPDDANSYYITNYVEQGNSANQILCLFIGKDEEDLWVDQAKETETDKLFTFNAQGDGTYKIGLSDKNKDFTPTAYEDTYLGLMPSKDATRLYLCNPYYFIEYANNMQVIWKLVSPANYSDYVSKKIIWLAAEKLGAAITKAETENEGIDITTVKNVYNNPESSAEQLNAAGEELVQIVMDFQTQNASPAKPADYSSLIANANYDNNNNDGWSGTTPGFQTFNNAEVFNNNYNVHQTISGLKNGVYTVGITAYYRAGSAEADAIAYGKWLESQNDSAMNAKLYATAATMPTVFSALPYASSGASETSITNDEIQTSYGFIPNVMKAAAYYMNNGQYKPTTITTYVSDGTITIGLKKDVQIGDDWTLFDTWTLHYLGDSDAAFKHLADERLAAIPDYETYIAENETAYHEKAAYNAYIEARTNLVNATTAAEYATAIPAYETAAATLKTSLEAYALYYASYKEADTFVNEEYDRYIGEAMDILSDYILSDDIEPNEKYPNGTALYILNNGTLTAEQIPAEITFLAQLKENAIASGMHDGYDCTILLKNPNFAEEDGWTKQPGVTFPTNGLAVGEGPNMLFDINQSFTGLQNGLYEFTVNAAYRAADNSVLTGEEDYKAYIYLNGYQKKMLSVLDDASAEQAANDDYNYSGKGYIPNSSAGAHAAFSNGRYEQKVYGLVTDGTMTLGLRNDLRYADGSCAWWSNARLTFRAHNAEILAEVITATIPEANALLNNKAGAPELDALSTAISTAETATEELFDVLVNLKQSMDDVTASTATYVNLATAITNLYTTIEEYSATASEEATSNAETLFNEVVSAYENSAYSNAEALAKIDEINLAAVAMKVPVIDDTQKETDVTHLIINPNFDPAKGDKNTGVIEGWTTSAMNGYKQNTVSYNRAPITLYQKLTGLPKGKYRVTVHTYYRAGYWYDEEALYDKTAPEKTHLTTLYATTSAEKFETKVMNLCEDAQPTNYGVKCYELSNGLYAPDGTSPTVEFFNQGHYLNELEFTVPEDGEVTIGLDKQEVLANDYEVVGAWKLYYVNEDAPVEQDTVDVTNLIVNPTFDPAKGDKNTGVIEGWTTSAMNGYKQNTVSYNRAAIDLYQDLVGLPKGKYLVTVHTYYRAGYWYDEEALYDENAPEKTHLTTLYASTSADKFETKVMNLCEDAQPTDYSVKCYELSNGLYAPDGTSPTVEFFNQGHYLNELEFTVPEDGKVRIGLSKTEVLANDYEVVGAWKLYYLGEETPVKKDTVDMTDLIINPTFDPAKGDKNTGVIEGWTTSAMNGYKQNTVSYNRAAIDLYQDLVGLPEGDYEVTVHTYYRAGYWYDEEALYDENAPEKTHLTTLYASTSADKFETKVMNLCEDAQPTDYSVKCYELSNGLYAPDGTTPTVEFFNQGHYLNKLKFTVPADGKVRIGLSKTEVLANDYEVVGAWKLYYLGKSENGGGETAIETVESAAEVVSTTIYSLNGAQLTTPQRGINIIRSVLSDGTVKVQKVLVR